jgi:hypothetical protein
MSYIVFFIRISPFFRFFRKIRFFDSPHFYSTAPSSHAFRANAFYTLASASILTHVTRNSYPYHSALTCFIINPHIYFSSEICRLNFVFETVVLTAAQSPTIFTYQIKNRSPTASWKSPARERFSFGGARSFLPFFQCSKNQCLHSIFNTLLTAVTPYPIFGRLASLYRRLESTIARKMMLILLVNFIEI